ncbi:MAG: hypothetical protein MHM6MM_002998 [Cercozoa sp. M6MM]
MVAHFPVDKSRRHCTCQLFVRNVILLESFKRRKFDLRVYVLFDNIKETGVSSYVHQRILTRFSPGEYQGDYFAKGRNNNYERKKQHVTNSAFQVLDNDLEPLTVPFDKVLTAIEEERGEVAAQTVATRLRAVLADTVRRVVPHLALFDCKACFKLLGFDLLVTDDLKLVLLEINSDPSTKYRTSTHVHVLHVSHFAEVD